jgi:hypothetical protein
MEFEQYRSFCFDHVFRLVGALKHFFGVVFPLCWESLILDRLVAEVLNLFS